MPHDPALCSHRGGALPCLRELDLSYCNLEPEQVACLLTECGRLRVLALNGCSAVGCGLWDRLRAGAESAAAVAAVGATSAAAGAGVAGQQLVPQVALSALVASTKGPATAAAAVAAVAAVAAAAGAVVAAAPAGGAIAAAAGAARSSVGFSLGLPVPAGPSSSGAQPGSGAGAGAARDGEDEADGAAALIESGGGSALQGLSLVRCCQLKSIVVGLEAQEGTPQAKVRAACHCCAPFCMPTDCRMRHWPRQAAGCLGG